MKKHARRLSIVLTLVMILTSLSFTGAFAGDDNANDGAAGTDQLQAVEQEAPAADGVVEELSAETAEEPAAEDSAAADPAAEELAADLPVSPEAFDAAGQEASETLDAEGQETPEVNSDGVAGNITVTWKVGKKSTTSKVNEGDVPVFDGTPMVEGYDESNYKFTGWYDGKKTYKPGESLDPVKEDTTYTAKFVSLNVKPAKPELKLNKNDQAFASYHSVYIEWKTIKDINGYAYDDSVKVKVKVEPTSSALNTKTVAATSKYHSPLKLDPSKTYKFKVSAVITAEDGTKATSSKVTVSGSPVKSIVYNVTIKESGTLQKHAGNGPKSYSVKAGSTVPTIRFQTGKYIFEYEGSIFYISQTRVGKATATYNKKGSWNYLAKEAEYYIKDRASVKNKDISSGAKSPTKNLIYVNTFCQHVYYFEGKNGAWECTDSWECGTGLASTPTPTGNYGVKNIQGRIAKKNSIPWWNLFNGNAALHATKPSDHRVGMIISNGCVRNPDAKAKKIYKKCKLKTRVLIN